MHTYAEDVSQNDRSPDAKDKAPANSETVELPAELDFFKYAEGGNGMGKVADVRKQRSADCRGDGEPERKRHKMDDDGNGQDHTLAGNATMQRHRVVAKGLNIPTAITSFQELQDRYQVSSLLISNLMRNGHLRPTGVQSHGIPVLLEVSSLRCPRHFGIAQL
jgi:ATP-dependent RNA helicase DDX52/ROK1